MTNPIPGADRERAGFIAEMLRLDIIDDEGFSCGDDGIYFDDVTEAAWKSWQAGRAAAKVGANVVAEIMTDKLQRLQGDSIKHIARLAAGAPSSTATDANDICQLPPADWYCTRKAGHDGPCAAIQHEPDRELDAGDHAAIARGMAKLAAGAPAETRKPVAWEFEYNPSGNPLASWNREVFFHEPKPDPKVRNVKAMCYFAAQPAPIAGDVEKDAAWQFLRTHSDELHDALVIAMGEASGASQVDYWANIANQLDAAMLANSSSGEAG